MIDSDENVDPLFAFGTSIKMCQGNNIKLVHFYFRKFICHVMMMMLSPIINTVKPVLRGHLCDKGKVA
jgi:hypothetical protein